MSTIYAGSRLDRLPLSPFHWRMLFLIGAGMFLDAFDIYLGGAVTGALLKEGWSTLALNATFVTATFSGFVIGAWSAGILGDRFGRRFSFQLNLAIFGAASLAAAFAPDMDWLIGLRFVMGIGLGAEIVVGYAMLSEFVPPRHRGKMLALLGLFANSSVFVATFVSLWVIPSYGWRPMFAGVGIAAIVVWVLRKTMPESPRWLEDQGRFDEAEAVVSDIEQQVARGGTLPDFDRTIQPKPAPVSFAVLFSRGTLSRTIVGCAIMMVIGYSVYGLLGWLPSFFVKGGFTIVKSLTWAAVIALGAPVGNLIGYALADRVGRKPIIVAACIAGSVFGLLYQNAANETMLLAMGFCLTASIYLLVTAGQGTYVPELFPTHYRMRGAGLCGAMGRLTSATCQFFILWLFTTGGVSLVVGSVVAALLVLAALVAFVGVETGGRRLEEIAKDVEQGDGTDSLGVAGSRMV